MDLHHGHIIEKVIRRDGYSISEVARLTNVNRRSVYNWFNQRFLKTDIIYKIGVSINHDFSVEFPHLFTSDDFRPAAEKTFPALDTTDGFSQVYSENDDSYWKDKYIALLEKYNDVLIKNVEKNLLKISMENNLR